MLEANLKAQLKGYLERLVQPVEIVASLDDGDKSREMLELIHDIVALSPLVTLDPGRDDPGIKPSFALRRPGQAPRVRFAGLPMGHEFTSLVLALLQTGGHPSKAAPSILEKIAALDGEFEFETFVSLSCQSCPDVVQALNLMAVVNPKIRHTMIDGAVFQGEVERRQVMAVPAVYLNGQPFGQGRMELEEIVSKLDALGLDAAAVVADFKLDVIAGRQRRHLIGGEGEIGSANLQARQVRRRRCTQRARASARGSRPSGSAVNCWIRWAWKTSSR